MEARKGIIILEQLLAIVIEFRYLNRLLANWIEEKEIMSQTMRGSVKSNFVQQFISKARFEPSFLTIELKLGDSIQTGQCCIANSCSSFFFTKFFRRDL